VKKVDWVRWVAGAIVVFVLFAFGYPVYNNYRATEHHRQTQREQSPLSGPSGATLRRVTSQAVMVV